MEADHLETLLGFWLELVASVVVRLLHQLGLPPSPMTGQKYHLLDHLLTHDPLHRLVMIVPDLIAHRLPLAQNGHNVSVRQLSPVH